MKMQPYCVTERQVIVVEYHVQALDKADAVDRVKAIGVGEYDAIIECEGAEIVSVETMGEDNDANG